MAKLLIGLIVILLGITILGIAVTALYQSDMRAVLEHIDSLSSQVVKTDCGPIEYARIGDGHPVLVVHGNAGGFDQGLMMANKTLDPEFQVIAVSRFGYLLSPMPANASTAMQADAFACLLDSLNIRQNSSRLLLGRLHISDPVCHTPPGTCLGTDPRFARWPG
jgi:hypothetical protein